MPTARPLLKDQAYQTLKESIIGGAYAPGSALTVDAAAATDWVFLDWMGCAAAAGTAQCNLSVDQHVVVRGRFGDGVR